MKPVNVSESKDKKLAAILVPLCIIDDQPSLLYTVRSPYLKVNGGQVSFPGGKKDKSDRTLLDTALRETFEEIGVATDKVAVWGSGPQIHRPDVIVTPFLGYIGNIRINNLKINTGEVAEVFTATLSHLSEKKNFHSTLFRFNNTHVYNTPVYTGTHKRIWGLTAVITHIILSALIPDIYNSNITFKLMMDPGHFLTNSGSKIPMPRSKKENILPVKTKLALSGVTTTNYTCEKTNVVEAKEVSRAKTTTNLKTSSSRSVPNIAKTATTLTRCKTGVALRSASAFKRTAAPTENNDVSSTKQPKVAPKTGFPYKAKNWELKARLTECEEWVIDLRTKCNEYETQCNTAIEELEEIKNYKAELENEKECLANEVDALKKSRCVVEDQLRSKTESYDKLYSNSKEFVDKIEKLEGLVTQRDKQIAMLQSDQASLREDLLAKNSKAAELQFKVDDLEFKTKRQKNQIEDLDNSLAQIRKENNELQSRIRDRDDAISNLHNKLDISERENKYKSSNLSDLTDDLAKAREKIYKLEKDVAATKLENSTLEEKLQRTTNALKEKTENGESLAITCDELKKKLCENEKLRRKLHNNVQDLKGNIRVFCRVRPPIQSEKENATPLCTISFPDEGSLEIAKSDPFDKMSNGAVSRPKFVKHEFSFDRVFNPGATQEHIFDELSQLVQSALDGYNVCVFAYGQTGSGKTYTMEGGHEKQNRGMIPRTVDHIFKSLEELELIGWKYTVEVSFLEIYNENIRDLLQNDKEGSSLKIMQVDGKTNDVTIPGLTIMKVDSYEDLDRLYLLAHQNRAVAYTSCNERSSRSHSVTRIKVTGVHQGRGEKCYGSLYLVDLAGSERLNEPMSDPRFREMKNINKSLSELGNVILGLLQKQEHIPYRNSKLTHLLQPALGGSSKTLMLVNISPIENCLQETLCSLRFAEKVNRVKTGTTRKRIAYDNSNLTK
ncbi:hypothetical protein RUM44_009037 [Polyplax serrata]|uniref:Kinesin-like protein n=1 Tax=Polyplax serrata TaxID=468196 RepID=A0ABR1ARJ3_POLSC